MEFYHSSGRIVSQMYSSCLVFVLKLFLKTEDQHGRFNIVELFMYIVCIQLKESDFLYNVRLVTLMGTFSLSPIHVCVQFDSSVFALFFFHLLARKPNLVKFSIYSNKFFHNFTCLNPVLPVPGFGQVD